MTENKYWDEYPSAVTICDTDAVIVYMNKKASSLFEKWGGKSLIGKSLYDCHKEKSCKLIANILKTGKVHTYTHEKNGKKNLIHQSPWYQNNIISGIIEINIELP